MRDPNDPRDNGPRIGSPPWIYLTAVTGAGGAVLAVAVVALRTAGLPVLIRQPLLPAIAVLCVIGELRPIVTPGKTRQDSGDASLTFSFAALLYWGFPVAAFVRLISGLFSALIWRRALLRAAFGIAQLALSLGAAWLVLLAAGIHPRPTVAVGAVRPATRGDRAGRVRVLRGRLPAGGRGGGGARTGARGDDPPQAAALPGLRQPRAAVRRPARGRGHGPVGAAGPAVPAAAVRRLRERRDVAETGVPGAARRTDRPAQPCLPLCEDPRGGGRGGAEGWPGRIPAARPGSLQAGQRHPWTPGRRPGAQDRRAPSRAQRAARRPGGAPGRGRVRGAAAGRTAWEHGP